MSTKNEGGSITKARLSNTFLGKELYRAGLIQEAFAEKKTCVRKPLPSIHPIHPEPVDLPESPDGMDSMEQQESADDAGGSTDAAPIDWLDEILPIDPDEDEYMP